jgi:hypothetical protein
VRTNGGELIQAEYQHEDDAIVDLIVSSLPPLIFRILRAALYCVAALALAELQLHRDGFWLMALVVLCLALCTRAVWIAEAVLVILLALVFVPPNVMRAVAVQIGIV